MTSRISKYVPFVAGLCLVLSGCATQQAVKESEEATQDALARIELQQQTAKAEMRDLHNALDKRLNDRLNERLAEQDVARSALAQKLDALEGRMTALQAVLDPLRAEMAGQAAQTAKRNAEAAEREIKQLRSEFKGEIEEKLKIAKK